MAISGAVKMLADTAQVERRDRVTEACYIAIRPCIAATDASGSTPVQSPAA